MRRDLSVRVVMLILAWFWVLVVEAAMVDVGGMIVYESIDGLRIARDIFFLSSSRMLSK